MTAQVGIKQRSRAATRADYDRVIRELQAHLPPPRASRLARAAIGLAVFAVPVTAISVLLLRNGKVGTMPALAAFGAGELLALAAAVTGAAALAEIWRRGTYGANRAFAAILIGGALLAWPAYHGLLAADLPPINDVTTDTVDPPRFQRAASLRRPGDNPIAYPGEVFAVQQRAAYPDLAPLVVDAPPEDVHGAVMTVAKEFGWRITERGTLPRGGGITGRIEAVDRTPLLRFADDIVIRIRPQGSGSRIDMRSASRVGRHDLGTNAQRIASFFAALSAELGGQRR